MLGRRRLACDMWNQACVCGSVERKGRFPVHQLPKTLHCDKWSCVRLVPARSQAQTALQTSLFLVGGSSWGSRGTVSALARRTLGLGGRGDRSCRVHTLFAGCMHISGDLYPPTSSRVIFAWREHSEVTLAKNNPARAGGGVGGSWRRAQLSQAGLLSP